MPRGEPSEYRGLSVDPPISQIGRIIPPPFGLDVNIIELRPGDILVAKVPEDGYNAEGAVKYLQSLLPKNQVVLIPAGTTFDVVRGFRG